MQEPRSEQQSAERQEPGRSEFLASLRTGALIGVAILAVLVPLRLVQKARMDRPPAAVAAAPSAQAPGQLQEPSGTPSQAAPSQMPAVRLADFKGEQPTADARLVANWVTATGDAGKHAFV